MLKPVAETGVRISEAAMETMIMPMMLAALLVLGCDDKRKAPSASGSARPEIGPTASAQKTAPRDPDIGRAKAMLGLFVAPNADIAKLSKELIPKDEDYAAVFVGGAVQEAKAGYGPRFERGQLNVRVNETDSEITVLKATTEQLRKREGNSLRFPGGYLRIAHRLRSGVSWYIFSFGAAGKKPSLTYDGLVFVNGHWAMFPSPGRVLSVTGSEDERAADVAGADGTDSEP
jgi:hypothetical protein